MVLNYLIFIHQFILIRAMMLNLDDRVCPSPGYGNSGNITNGDKTRHITNKTKYSIKF